jgi:hypothetical protein
MHHSARRRLRGGHAHGRARLQTVTQATRRPLALNVFRGISQESNANVIAIWAGRIGVGIVA